MKTTTLIVLTAGLLMTHLPATSADAWHSAGAQTNGVIAENPQMNGAPYFPETFPIYVVALLLTVIVGTVLLDDALHRNKCKPTGNQRSPAPASHAECDSPSPRPLFPEGRTFRRLDEVKLPATSRARQERRAVS